jgi:hypothetical protein
MPLSAAAAAVAATVTVAGAAVTSRVTRGLPAGLRRGAVGRPLRRARGEAAALSTTTSSHGSTGGRTTEGGRGAAWSGTRAVAMFASFKFDSASQLGSIFWPGERRKQS